MSEELRKWIEEVQQRCDAATEGPWEARHVYDLSFVEFQDVSAHGRAYKVPVAWCYWQHRTTTSEFIAHARTDLPTALSHLRDLLARAEAAEAERDRLRAENKMLRRDGRFLVQYIEQANELHAIFTVVDSMPFIVFKKTLDATVVKAPAEESP